MKTKIIYRWTVKDRHHRERSYKTYADVMTVWGSQPWEDWTLHISRIATDESGRFSYTDQVQLSRPALEEGTVPMYLGTKRLKFPRSFVQQVNNYNERRLFA